MGCLYTPATNRIDVTGYTSDVPCTFDELYIQDKAGTLELRTAISAAMNLSLTQAIRSAEELALKIDLVITNHSANGNVTLTGKDKDGGVQTEVVSITGNGTFTTTKWFKSIDNAGVDCTGTYTIQIIQNRWGVIWDLTHLQTVKMGYSIDAFIYVGAAGVHGYFGDTKKTILVERHKTYATYVNFMEAMDDYGHITFGIPDLINKRGYSGVDFTAYIRHTSKRGKKPFIKGKDVNCYGCDFQGLMSRANYHRTYTLDYCDGNLYDNTFYQWYYPIARAGDNTDINGLNAAECLSPFESCSALMTLNDIKSYNQNFGLYCGGMVIRNMVMSGIITNEIYMRYTGDLYMIDCMLETWSVGCASDFSCIHRQYTYNLKVLDKDGNGIGGATVVLKDKDGNTIDQKGFETTTSDDPATRGEIPEQIVGYGYYDRANGNTLQSYSPHTLTISKAGYQTYEKKLTLDEKINWRVRSYKQVPLFIVGSDTAINVDAANPVNNILV